MLEIQKKKKQNKIGWFLFLFLLICAAGIATFFWYKQKVTAEKESSSSTQEEVTLEEGQEFLYGEIETIIGNEITIASATQNEKKRYEVVDDAKTTEYTIPVGTDVVTKLGTTTTFSRLASGDIIKMLMEKTEDGTEEIMQIWIIQ